MSAFAFIDCRLEINSVVMSTFGTAATLNISAAELETTAFGQTYRSRIGGLKDWSLAPTFNSDFAASATDALLFPLLGTVVTAKVRPTSSAISPTNPEYSGSVLISQYNPFGNSVGDLATVSGLTWPGAGTCSRATS
jgi:hypothetical protein